MKIAIVDDEPLARDYLNRILAAIPSVEISAAYKNGRQAIAGLQNDPVDVVFLDVQMPGLTGIDVVKALQADVMPLMVFATAHSEFAVDAFELHAVDYILKPFAEERVAEALNRCQAASTVPRAPPVLTSPSRDLRARVRHLQLWAPPRGLVEVPSPSCDQPMWVGWRLRMDSKPSWSRWMISIGSMPQETTCACTLQVQHTSCARQ